MKVKIEYEYDAKYQAAYFAKYKNKPEEEYKFFASSKSFEEAKDKLLKYLADVVEVPEPEEIEL